MLRFVATLTLLLSLSTATPEQSFYKPHRSAASDSQITFALENNYDDTGPGAKTREYAYKTYKHLEDVLIGYIEDKDTILPEAERSMAIKTLQKKYPSYHKHSLQRFQPKTVDEYIGYNTAIDAEKQAIINLNPVRENIRQYNNRVADLQAFLNPTEFRSVNTGPRYTSPSENIEESKREYSYSYKVNDAETGDQKAAHEHREGDTVRGYYSLLDADGSMRIVKYRADDDGFHAVVDRSE